MKILNGFFGFIWLTNTFFTGYNVARHDFHGFAWWANLIAAVGGGFLLVRGYVISEAR